MSTQLQLFANNATTTLQTGAGLTDGTLTLVDGSKFPSPSLTPAGQQYFLLTLESSGIIEVVRAIGRSGNTITLVDGVSGTATVTADGVHGRGQEGTPANIFPMGTIVECRVTKNTLSNFLPTSNYLPSLVTTSLNIPSSMASNAYIAGVDDGGASVLAVAVSTTAWSFPTFSPQSSYTGTATGGSTTQLTATNIPTSIAANKYIVQFTSGANIGYVRPITGTGAGYVTISALPNAVINGDSYTIYQSNYSILAGITIGSSNDDALIYSIALGG